MHLTEEELQRTREQKAAQIQQSTNTNFEAEVETEQSPPVFDILSKLTAGLGKAVAQNENLDPNSPLKNLINSDFMKAFGSGGLERIDPNFMKALGNSDSLRNLLGAAQANGAKDPLNIAKMFPQKVLDDIFNGNGNSNDQDAHNAVDTELAKILGIEKEKVAEHRKRTFAKFSEIAKNGDIKLDEIFDENFKSSLFRDL